jgi:hypothetical protein
MTNFTPSIRSIKIFEKAVYLLINIPRLEIIEIADDGKVIRQFMNQVDFNQMQWTDFSITRENGALIFYVMGFKRFDKEASQEYAMYRVSVNK